MLQEFIYFVQFIWKIQKTHLQKCERVFKRNEAFEGCV